MSKFQKILVGLVGLCLVTLYCIWRLPDGRLHVSFMDVGQGDAVLLRGPMGELVLVDGGPDGLVLDRMGRELLPYEREIEMVIVSHPHADHIAGLIEVLRNYQVRNLLFTGVKYDYSGYRELMSLAKARGVRVLIARSDEDFRVGWMGFDVVYPTRSLEGKSFPNVNNSSIVFRLVYGEKMMMFSGDLEEEKEKEVVAGGADLKADLLKAGHHGSKTSNSAGYLAKVAPSVVVISCGVDNQFGHPFAGTLERLLGTGAEVWRTDLDGTVEGESDGEVLSVRAVGK